MNKQRTGRNQPYPPSITPRQEVKADRDREGKLEHRRHSPRRDVFHPVTEKRVSRQIQLARQRGVKIDAVPPVWPEVKQCERIERLLEVSPGVHMAHLLPPLGREQLAVTVCRFIPRQPEITHGRNQRNE